MNKIIAVSALILLSNIAWAQNDNLLFDDSDIIVRANTQTQNADIINKAKDNADAVNMAKDLLKSAPRRLEAPTAVSFSSAAKPKNKKKSVSTFAAPFGLLWNASVDETTNQGVELTPVEMKDYPNSFQASHLPKSIDFFERVYVSFGEMDELNRILVYSHPIEDNAQAAKTLKYYKIYSENLDNKYGNMQQFFTPAPVEVKKDQNAQEAPQKDNSIGNPDFLAQLTSGEAVLYSTYHNDNVSATLSINVDGEQKSYIVIDYSNLQVIKKQEKQTFDAL